MKFVFDIFVMKYHLRPFVLFFFFKYICFVPNETSRILFNVHKIIFFLR